MLHGLVLPTSRTMAKNFTGNFTIDGVITDWEGTYTLKREGYRIQGISDFIYYPNNQRSAAHSVQKIYYL